VEEEVVGVSDEVSAELELTVVPPVEHGRRGSP
jgi:hypothetical protein